MHAFGKGSTLKIFKSETYNLSSAVFIFYISLLSTMLELRNLLVCNLPVSKGKQVAYVIIIDLEIAKLLFLIK